AISRHRLKRATRVNSYTHDARHVVAAVDQRCSRPIEAHRELKAAALGRGEPVLELAGVLRRVALDVDDELAAFGVQLAALQHVAVDGVAVESDCRRSSRRGRRAASPRTRTPAAWRRARR